MTADVHSTDGALPLNVAIVMFYARLTVLVQTLPNVFGRVIYCCADLAKEGLVLYALEQVVGHWAVVLRGKQARLGHSFKIVKVYLRRA